MILEKLKDMIAEMLGKDKSEITADSDIIKDIGADSLDIVEMLMNVENEWGITIDDDEVASMHTVGDVVKFIENRIK